MIGITKISSGRMGNRLFQYHFLRQVAKRSGLEYFHPKFPDAKYFEGMEKKKRPFSLVRKQIRLTAKDIRAFAPADFITFIMEKDAAGFDIILDPPLLGDLFFDYLFYPPTDLIIIRREYQKDFDFNVRGKVIIGLHFRGTDFKSWNEQASLGVDYYKKAILFCRETFGSDMLFVLFTDDHVFPTFVQTKEYLEKEGAEVYVSNNIDLPIVDFYQMSRCDVLISSPSTFAIFAGYTGKRKKIIHDKAWLEYSIGRNDYFWAQLLKTENPHYSLWQTF